MIVDPRLFFFGVTTVGLFAIMGWLFTFLPGVVVAPLITALFVALIMASRKMGI